MVFGTHSLEDRFALMLDFRLFIPLIAAGAQLYLFSYVAGQRQRSKINTAFLLFSIGMFIVCLLEFAIYLPVAVATASFLTKCALAVLLFAVIAESYFVYSVVRDGSRVFLT